MDDIARRLFDDTASEENKRALPRCEAESRIALYHELLRLSAPLQFDQILTQRGGRGGFVYVNTVMTSLE